METFPPSAMKALEFARMTADLSTGLGPFLVASDLELPLDRVRASAAAERAAEEAERRAFEQRMMEVRMCLAMGLLPRPS